MSFDYNKLSYDENYPIIYTKNYTYRININQIVKDINIRNVLGKKENGKFELIILPYDKENGLSNIFKKLRNMNIKKISIFIIEEKRFLINKFNIIMKNIYPEAKIQLCMTKILSLS